MRIGQGFDAHAFVEGRRLVLGGVTIPHARGLAGHSVVLLSGSAEMTGGVVSLNVMCCTQVAIFPHPSVAFQVRSIPALPVQLAAVGVSV